MQTIELKHPYLIFVGAAKDRNSAKTGFGLVEWRRDLCAGQFNLRGCKVDLGIPVMNLQQAVDAGAKSLVIGTAFVGGRIPDKWLAVLVEALELGLDIVAGVHSRLIDIPVLRAAALRSGVSLIDLRIPPRTLPIATGKKRAGLRLLTVGTDCALGKKFTALALERDMRACDMDVDFRASGQTGIMIAGAGLPIDAVAGDFISGAAECLSPDNNPDHWDIIEGQASLFHPGYSAVSLGLLLGSQPDAFVVCHEVGRTNIMGWPDYRLPSIGDVIERTVSLGRLTNESIRCVGISVNTSKLSQQNYKPYLQKMSQEWNLPCIDPLRDGTQKIIERLQEDF